MCIVKGVSKEDPRKNFATFNVRGLTEDGKKQMLIEDLKKKKVEVCCLQETKISSDVDLKICGYRLINIEPEQKAYGQGFVISPRWSERVYKYWKETDRISVLQLDISPAKYEVEASKTDLKMKITRAKTHKCKIMDGLKIKIEKKNPERILTFINIYAPHTGRLRESIDELDEMYSKLDELMTEFSKSRYITIICGDFNAKVGRYSDANTSCMGQHGRGKTNNSGMNLIEFCEAHKLFISNTAFRHSERHKTTWESRRNIAGKEIIIYNQIDYVVCSQRIKSCLVNSRSYSGTLTDSDHRIVISTMDLRPFRLYKTKTEKKENVHINESRLVKNESIRDEFQAKIDEKIQQLEENQECVWKNVVNVINDTAKEVLSEKTGGRGKRESCQTIQILSEKQKEIRLKIDHSKNNKKIAEMKHKRNTIMKDIRREIKKRNEEEQDAIAEEIEQATHSSQMHKAVKNLNRKRPEPLYLFDEKNRRITEKHEVHRRITEYYKEKFQDSSREYLVHDKNNKPLEKRVTIGEVRNVIKSLKNGKAAGHDNIKAEFIKYGGDKLHKTICRVINAFFEGGEVDIGRGIIVPLQKPGKKAGVLKNLRPVTLLPVIRKIMSLIIINRTRNETENFISPSQSAYRSNRSTTDIVWCFKWLLAKVQKYQISLYVTGIDMTSAFDTIDREKLLEIYDNILENDEMRMVKTLLSNTTLEVKIPDFEQTETFKSNIGSPQGDGASGVNFNVYFEDSLQEVRNLIHQDHTYHINIPEEAIYADDADLITENEKDQKKIQERVGEILRRNNLFVNEDKTELTELKRGLRTEESWRKVKKLGTLLGEQEEFIRRKNLAMAALGKLQSLWKRSHKVRMTTRIRIYNSLVKSILLYNCETWAMTKTDKRNFNSFHRRQLRRVMNIKYPQRIGNDSVYETCHAEPIELEILERRWRFFGHVLRLPEETPCWKAMKSFFGSEGLKKFKGRPRTTIATTLNEDIKRLEERNPVFCRNVGFYRVTNLTDLKTMKELAMNRQRWKNITNCLYTAVKAEGLS